MPANQLCSIALPPRKYWRRTASSSSFIAPSATPGSRGGPTASAARRNVSGISECVRRSSRVYNGGVTSSGGSILELFATDAQVYFPKWGLAVGREQIGKLFGEVGGTLKSIVHHFSEFNWIFSGSDFVVCEGTSHGEHRDGPWRAGAPDWAAGRWCDVFEIRDWQIQRCFIYLDPDYAGKDTKRYPWLAGQAD